MKRIITLLGTLPLCMGMASQVVINEIMQSNIDCVYDDIHEFPDSWVEIYNSGDSPVNLSNFSIGLTANSATAWKLPYQTLGAKQYALVYCDKAAQGMHTDFRLESGKGDVYLYQNSTLVDHLNHKKMPAPNIAYGRESDGSDTWGYQLTPSPGKTNQGGVSSKILGDPVFSKTGGCFKTAQTVALSIPDDAPEGTLIRYTIDGSEPTKGSAQYTKEINVTNNRVIRAKLFCEGWLSPRSTTNSYIFHGRDVTLPVISIVTDKKYFYDNEKGIYVEGNHSNFWNDWRRPINFELFEKEGKKAVLNQLCETRVKGGATRGEQLKSLAVYANKRFGIKRFDYEFFPEDMPGLTDWKSIELRNSGNDFHYTYFRDAAMQASMGRHCDLDWQPWQPAIIYINGTYLGILNIRSRSNEDLIYTTYDGLEDVDVIENWNNVKEGSMDEFNRFKAFYEEKDHTLAEYEKWMDVDEFINYFALNLIMCNQDWPANNLNMWREHGEQGKWRWIVKDTDFGLGLYGQQPDYKILDWIYWNDYDNDRKWGNTYEATRLFRRLMDISEFKNRFFDRICTYLGDFLRVTDVSTIIDGMKAELDYEYPYHRKLINEWWPNWDNEVGWLKEWYGKRVPFFYGHMATYFGLGSAIDVIIKGEDGSSPEISVNDVVLEHDNFTGKWNVGRMMRLHADIDGAPAGAWKVETNGAGGTTTHEYRGADLQIGIPQASSVIITAMRDGSGVDTLDADCQIAEDDCWYDLTGIRISRPTSAGIYIHNGRKVVIQ